MFIRFELSEDGKFKILEKETKKIRNKGKSLLLLTDNYTVIDVETTGFNPNIDEIIEIGALKVREGVVIDKFESLIKPKSCFYDYDDDGNGYFSYIDESITELTGITNEMLHNAPSIDDVLPRFVNFIQDDILIAHNANFDINFLYDSILISINKELSNDFIDTLRLSRKAYPEFKTHKLKYLAETLKLQSIPAHRTISDCYATLELYLKCKRKIVHENIDLKPKRSYLKSSKIIANTDACFDEENPLFNKVCVFTGTLEKMVRKDAMQAVVNIGGLVGNTVNSKTNYLIMGIQDYSKFADGKESSKTKKAKALIEREQDLVIISEHEFYELIFGIDISSTN